MPASVAGTQTPLAANGEWTGPWIQRLGHHEKLEGSVFADQGGTLHIDETQRNPEREGGGAADTTTTSEVKSDEGVAVEHKLTGRWWRVRYVNGGTKQGAFRLGISAHPRSGGLYEL